MRKYFLVALMAATMIAAALPAASVANRQASRATQASCQPGSHDCVCPPGTHDPTYCVRGTRHGTAEACAVAGVNAADSITGSSKRITVGFKAGVQGECHFTLLFADPGSHPKKYVSVGQAVIQTYAGKRSTVTVSLNATGRRFLATDAAGHLTQAFEVIANEVTSTGNSVVHLFGSFSVS